MNSAISIIEKAQKMLKLINLDLPKRAYYVTQDGDDMTGGEYYCINCIKKILNQYKKEYKEKRKEIINKYKVIINTGYWNDVNIKSKYSEAEFKKRIIKSKKYELKDNDVEKPYSKIEFDYEDCDPDFSGGLTSPRTCDECGEYFDVCFIPDIEEAESMLDNFKNSELGDILKWKLDTSFDNYDDCDKDVQKILLKIANQLIKGE